MQHEALLRLSPATAIFIALLCLAIMAVTMIHWAWVPHLAMMLVVCLLLIWGRWNGLSFQKMQKGMAQGVMSGIAAIYLFFFIGILVAALMFSGAIPTLIYEGFSYISPRYFYFAAFAFTSLLGIAIGSSLTTCATLGVAFMGMASAFGMNPAITAGAVVSGAFFGDKMSPLSDTTGIAASITGIDLFEHIKNMLYTTIPAWLLSALMFLVLSKQPYELSMNDLSQIKQQLMATGLIYRETLWTFAVLIVLAMLRCNAIYTIIATVCAALFFTGMNQDMSLADLGRYFFAGYQSDEDLGMVSAMVSRGGINSMFFTQTIVIWALSLGGLLQTLGVIPALLRSIAHLLGNMKQLSYSVVATALGTNVLIGEQYLSILLAGNTFKAEYEKLGVHPRHLARSLEDAGTVINPLVPWSVCGVFIADMLKVPVFSYLPYAFFCYFCLILTLLYIRTGWTMKN